MFPEFIQPLLTVLSQHPYLFIFIGLLIAGELVLLPSIYLAVTGRLELGYVFGVAVSAMAIADLFWYFLGRSVPRARLKRFTAGRVETAMVRMEQLFLKRGPQILIGSKFVYGTRTAVQILSGVHEMRVGTYFAANSVGVLLLVSALCAIGYSVRGSLQRLGEFVGQMEVAFLIFVVVAVGGHLLVARILRRQWSR